MADMTVREVQLSCFEILKEFDGICRRYGLRYYLSGGTLLGAVRHKGFIPWDDDMDVMMPRADYERLLKLEPELRNGQYRLLYLGYDDIYNRPWARFTDTKTSRTREHQYAGERFGTFVDVFPIDGIPSGKIRTNLFFATIRMLDAMSKCAKRNYVPEHERLRFLKKLLIAIFKPFDPICFARAMNKLAMRCNYDTCKRRGVVMITHYGQRESMPAEVFDHAVDMEFEGMTVPAPNGWDTYLSRLYGDYMQIPPEHRGEAEGFTHSFRFSQNTEANT